MAQRSLGAVTPAVVFSHGQESGPWGTKIRIMARAVAELGCRAESIDYQGIAEPSARVRKLVEACRDMREPLVLVGSSMGGYVATAAAAQVGAIGLFVLAPAFYVEDWPEPTPPAPRIPMVIVHGWRDDVVPVDHSIRFARSCRATLHLLDGDHRLTDHAADIAGCLARFVAGLGQATSRARR